MAEQIPSQLQNEGSVFFPGKKLLLLQASLTSAALTAQSHLGRARLTLLEMRVGNVCKCLDEDRVSVQALCPLDARAIGFMHNLQVQLIQGLDVVAREGNRNQKQIFLASFDIFLHRVACLGSEPCRRAHLRLPAQAVGVAEVETLHDRVDGCSDFCWIGITCQRKSSS